MKTGAEDKKKVIALVAMLVIIIPAAIWELHGSFSTPTQPQRPFPATTAAPRTPQAHSNAAPAAAAQASAAPEAERIGGIVADPTLHLAKLAQSEDIDYEGTGRNIFSAESAPINIPPPIAPPRPNDIAQVTTPPPPPQAPAIDLKYFGYEESHDKSMKAFLIHGDDIFMARSGEVVDHRYKVGNISPGSIQVTDLAYNNTQTLPMSPN